MIILLIAKVISEIYFTVKITGKKRHYTYTCSWLFFNGRNQIFAYHRPTLLLNRHLELKTYFGNVFCSSLNNVVIVRSVL